MLTQMSRCLNTEALNKAVQCVTSSITTDITALPNRETKDKIYAVLPEVSHTLSVDLDKLQQQQNEDVCLREVITWLHDNKNRPPIGHLKRSSPTLGKLWHELPKLVIQQGILCRMVKTGSNTPVNFQVVYYWPYMTRNIHKFCAECLACQTLSCHTPHERAPLQLIQAEKPFQKVAADISELPVMSSGNRYVLVVMDYFTR